MIVWHALEAAAITLVFTKGTIFRPLREAGPPFWRELAACALCAGAWIGFAWRLLRVRPVAPILELAVDVLASGAVTGVLALFASLVLSLLDRWS